MGSPALAGDEPPPVVVAAGMSAPRLDEPVIWVPRFQPAPALLADAARLGAGPPSLVLDATGHRLVVSGPPTDRPAILEILDFLDEPTPQAVLRLGVVETLVSDRLERGGHALFDRAGGEGPDTVFRGVRSVFEPDAYLRSLLPGQPPFPGTDVRFGDDSEGAFDAVLRSLLHRGEAELHACPFLVLTQGVPARLESTVELPETVFTGSHVAITATPVREKAGISLEAVAERIGSDHVVLRVKAWLRQVVASEAEGGPPGYPVLATREIDVRVRVDDRRSTVVGGLGAFERASSRRGLPGLAVLPILDAVASARRRTSAKTEICFLATAAIRTPGRPAPRRPVEPPPADQSAAPKRPLDS